MAKEITLELVLFGISCLILLGYHFFVWRPARRDPERSAPALHDRVRLAWVRNVMQATSKDILAVQTLRNSVMAASFMASTVALAITGTLTLSSEADKLAVTFHRMHGLATASALLPLKVFLLMGVLFASFLYFSLAIRLFNHTGYLVTLPMHEETAGPAQANVSPEMVGGYLNRAGRYYGSGLRCFYLSLPLVAWLFDVYFMLVATLALLILRRELDRWDDEGES